MPRPVGSRNKPRVAVLAALKQQFGKDWDPLLKMAEHANAMAERITVDSDLDDYKQVVDAFEKVTKYVHPQLKAAELDLSNSDGSLSQPTKVRLVAVSTEKAPETPLEHDKPESGPVTLEHSSVSQKAIQRP